MMKTSRFKMVVILLMGAHPISALGQDVAPLDENLDGRELPPLEDEYDPGSERDPTDPVVPGIKDYEPGLDEDYGFGVDEDEEFGVENELGGVEEENDVPEMDTLDDSPLFDDELTEPDIFE